MHRAPSVHSSARTGGWRVSTYAGRDHEWHLLVIESVHVISVIRGEGQGTRGGRGVGGYLGGGKGEVFALKRRCTEVTS